MHQRCPSSRRKQRTTGLPSDASSHAPDEPRWKTSPGCALQDECTSMDMQGQVDETQESGGTAALPSSTLPSSA